MICAFRRAATANKLSPPPSTTRGDGDALGIFFQIHPYIRESSKLETRNSKLETVLTPITSDTSLYSLNTFKKLNSKTKTMVEIEEVTPTPSEERLLDAQAIEEAAAQMTRITAKLHLEALAKKLRKESDALKRVEKSRAMLAEAGKTASAVSSGDKDESRASKEGKSKEEAASSLSSQDPPAPVVAPTVAKPPAPAVAKPPPLTDQAKYVPIDKFAFDFGDYNSKFVSIYIDLPFVGTVPKDQITCDFQTSSFDLIVKNLERKSYRLVKTNLEKDIDPDKSKFIVKSDKIVIKLAKIKGEYGSFDYWSKLTDEKKGVKKSSTKNKSDDPASGLMDMMQEMYASGDDKMKKVIGETMMKQRRGELDHDSAFGGL